MTVWLRVSMLFHFANHNWLIKQGIDKLKSFVDIYQVSGFK